MFNLIRADLYKAFHRMYLYIFMGVMAAAAISYNVLFAYAGAPREVAFGSALSFFMFPLFLVSMFVDIVTAEENKEHTLKNTISFGISRSKLYLAKNISAVIIAAAVAAVTLGAFFVSGLLFLKAGEGFTSSLMPDIFLRISVALLLYIAAIAMGTLLAAVVKRNTLFTFAYFGMLVIPVMVFKLLKLANHIFSNAEYAMLLTQTQVIARGTQAQLLTAVWIALAHIALFVPLGLFLFKRQEIN